MYRGHGCDTYLISNGPKFLSQPANSTSTHANLQTIVFALFAWASEMLRFLGLVERRSYRLYVLERPWQTWPFFVGIGLPQSL